VRDVPLRRMYNEPQKKEYIAYEKNNSVSLENYFKRIEKGEVVYDKDIADMNRDELIETLTALEIRREETRNHLLSLLRGYIKWAKLNDKTQNNSAIEKITGESIGRIDTVASKMIKSEEQLIEILNKAINVDGKKGYYNQPNRADRDRLVFWLLWFGLRVKHLVGLSKTDIDYDKKLIVFIDEDEVSHEYKVNEDVVLLWKSYASAESLEGGWKGEYELLDNDYLFRATFNENQQDIDSQQFGSFSMILVKVFNLYSDLTGEKIQVKPEGLRSSGAFYTTYIQEKSGEKYSMETLAKNLKMGYNTEKEKMMMRKWEVDYFDWKIAFGYM
jgi:integrase